jgi:DNA-binding transcriptional regulator YiaG
MTERARLPEPRIGGHDAAAFATSTATVKAARERLLANPRAADAHRALSAQVAERLRAKEASLSEIRRALGFTQAQLADMLGLGQGDVSRLEHRRNLYLSTLARFIEATGGRLRVSAVYGDTEVTLNFEEADGDAVDAIG